MKNRSKEPAGKFITENLPSGIMRKKFAGAVTSHFAFESELEDWLRKRFDQLVPGGVLLGRQVKLSDAGKSVDLLGLTKDGNMVIVELKRDRAEREAFVQLMEYSFLLDGLLHDQLELIGQVHQQKSLTEFYEAAFSRVAPAKWPRKPILILVAEDFDAATRNLALFLNLKHKFQIKLVSYTSTNAGDEKLLPELFTVIDPSDRVFPVRPLPESVVTLRIKESHACTWADCMTKGKLRCDDPTAAVIQSVLQLRDVTLLVYLDFYGYVGLGSISRDGQCARCENDANFVEYPVCWETALPFDRARFLNPNCQPSSTAQILTDDDLWAKVVGQLYFEAAHKQREKLGGAVRHPFIKNHKITKKTPEK